MFTFIASVFQKGGLFMWPIAILLFLGVFVAIERFIKLKFVFSVRYDRFMKEIEEYLSKEDIKGAVQYCNKGEHAILPKVIKAGLVRAFRDEKQVEQGIEVAMLRFYPLVKRNTKYLSIIANVATLLGLLGTIFGLIGAFAAVAEADPTQKQALLASGISIAMNTTAFGLITAIPCMLAHGYLSTLSEKIFDQVDEASAMLMDMLSARMYQAVDETAFDGLKDASVPVPVKEVFEKS
jgi:biopolymer transport protein ExbB